MAAPFKIGDKIRCIDDSDLEYIQGRIRSGEVYTVMGIEYSPVYASPENGPPVGVYLEEYNCHMYHWFKFSRFEPAYP